MDSKPFVQALKRIFQTTHAELDCAQVQNLLPHYVELELNGDDPAKQFPAFVAHLRQCSDCAEDHLGLYDVCRLQAHDRFGSADEILKRFSESGSDIPDPETEPLPEKRPEFAPR